MLDRSHAQQRVAGQALVQFVRSPQTHQQYAVKLFASRSAFEDEKGLYLTCCRGLFMPAVLEFVDNEDGSFRDPAGNAMPPCFVMEKGESLTERTARCKNDLVTIVQVRSVAIRVVTGRRGMRPRHAMTNAAHA